MKWIRLGEAALRSSDASVKKNFAAAAVSGAQESDRRRLAQRLSSWMPHAAKYRQSLRDAANHAVSIWRCNGPQPGQCVTTPAIIGRSLSGDVNVTGAHVMIPYIGKSYIAR
jgi:hypothetical protein